MLAVLFAVIVPQVVAAAQNSSSMRVTETVGVDLTSFERHETGQPLAVPLKRIDHRGVATPSLGRRFFKTDVLGVFGAAYLAELTIGTSKDGKKQVIDLLIDTGSFEMWVNPTCSKANVPEFCEAFGHYDPRRSSTSQRLNGRFMIKYGSGQVAGDYYKDDIYISGAKIENQQFGVANSSELVWFGILGLAHGQGNGFINYPVLIDSITAKGLAKTKMFSMDLGNQISPGGAVVGELVFGGVDTNKYSGLLKKVRTDPGDPHYRVTLNSLAHRPPGSTKSTPFIDSNLPVSVIIDSGTTLSLLPEPVVEKIAAQFPGAQPDGAGGYKIDCSYQSLDGSVDFSFFSESGPVTINVVYRDFIWNSGGDCFLGVWSSNELGLWILGDTFLRGAYIAFDQTNNALFMSNYVSCGDGQSNLVTVPAGPNEAAKIPGACNVAASSPSASTSTSSATYPSGTVSSAVIPTAASSLGGTVNPVSPPVVTEAPTSGLSPSDGPDAAAVRKPEGVTVTETITRAVVYTVAGCPETVVHCPYRDQVSTRFETAVTTYCPGHGDSAITLTEASVPAKTLVIDMGSGNSGSDEQQQGLEQDLVTTTTYIPTTTIYKVLSCADGACTAGKTTTRVITVAKTVVVHPVPTAAAEIVPTGWNDTSIKNGSISPSWHSGDTNIVVSAAAPLDDAKVDRRFLGAVFGFVWGAMVLL
ncbi:aspartic peptidase domain-containing protein [Xylaria bambusicola]|uniref:aspartic peptidase domain-containing protein n=1 Tax=Xylaria bambusicola TaxID=326684 RepID=UPI0020079ED1|nr:aspartic peptidase domain-containing protein [Xylaria bambusicola]KAI0517040.1 aspartic peptidase domain-containing protein [Xylaria bambusicola]